MAYTCTRQVNQSKTLTAAISEVKFSIGILPSSVSEDPTICFTFPAWISIHGRNSMLCFGRLRFDANLGSFPHWIGVIEEEAIFLFQAIFSEMLLRIWVFLLILVECAGFQMRIRSLHTVRAQLQRADSRAQFQLFSKIRVYEPYQKARDPIPEGYIHVIKRFFSLAVSPFTRIMDSVRDAKYFVNTQLVHDLIQHFNQNSP